MADSLLNDNKLLIPVSLRELDSFIHLLCDFLAINSADNHPHLHSLANLEAMVRDGDAAKFWPLALQLLAEAKKSQKDHQRNTQKVLNDLISELLAVEKEIVASFAATSQALSKNGNNYDKQLVDYMGGLAQEINQAQSLNTLKTTAALHLGKMRESIKQRRDAEKVLFEENNRQIQKLSDELEASRQSIVQLSQQSKLNEEEALTCHLTKIGNKRAMDNLLNQVINDESFRPFCLAVVDVDNFKHFDDNFGHQAGDKVLITITQQVLANLRPEDSFFRYAGDEFVAIFRHTQIDQALDLMEKVRVAIEAIRFKYKNQELRITISAGLAQAQPNDSPTALFEKADMALLESKRKNRNCVSVYENL